MLPGAVVVRTVCDDNRKSVCAMPRPRQVIAGGLAGCIGRGRGVAAVRGSNFTVSERSKNFVGRHLKEPKMIASLRSKARPVTQCRLQENIDSHDIGFDERIRSIDRSV